MNDPNGLVHYDGEWHLFYQHYPHQPRPMNIHWGHAVSKDLITWIDLPIAIKPEDEKVGIWSGSVVIDLKNVTGYQRETTIHTMIAIYTCAKLQWQEQHMAYSLDRGRTWTKYYLNPIITLNSSISKSDIVNIESMKTDFRDPKVMFHEATSSWILVLTGGNHVQFYKSTDLIHWTLTSRFGYEHVSHDGLWECPDLIEFSSTRVKNQTSLWVLLVSVGNNAIAGGTGMRYFIGTFNGNTFQNLQSSDTINWLDYGPDFYAGITYHNVPRYDGRQIIISWMNNWRYAQDLPTAPLWRGEMSIPRQLKLDYSSFTKKYFLRQLPVHEVYSYSRKVFIFHRQVLNSSTSNILRNISSHAFIMLTEFHNITKDTVIRLHVRQSLDKREYTEIIYLGTTNEVEFDRTHSGNIKFHSSFFKRFRAPLDDETLITGILKLQILVDRCSVEVFINGGKYTITALVFPQFASQQLELSVEGQPVILNYIELVLL
ncbi:unnamed protein product [Rotaria sp. Silwood1]|nr:unnamed protein product [Rotaria sp. Silwood1]CAF1587625.1 unnamed protein product [Rotaria sp. Silwood1]CAF3624607.1 unnamed protein product [Rotaria sp. Silwood1]CAF3698292.1 unnamed protein product [Rotaria sp. Silwood1]CAF4514164.1 unnamed protein product [Rotaria sp. Silwood1]